MNKQPKKLKGRKTIYALGFTREEVDSDLPELMIGLYKTRKEAKAAIRRRFKKPGFIDYPAGFQILPYVLGEETWFDGFKFKAPFPRNWGSRFIMARRSAMVRKAARARTRLTAGLTK